MTAEWADRCNLGRGHENEGVQQYKRGWVVHKRGHARSYLAQWTVHVNWRARRFREDAIQGMGTRTRGHSSTNKGRWYTNEGVRWWTSARRVGGCKQRQQQLPRVMNSARQLTLVSQDIAQNWVWCVLVPAVGVFGGTGSDLPTCSVLNPTYAICRAIARWIVRRYPVVNNRWIYFICFSFHCLMWCIWIGCSHIMSAIFWYPTLYYVCYGELLNQPCNGTMGYYVPHSGNNMALQSTMDFWQLTMLA